jgi:hypothetical protein
MPCTESICTDLILNKANVEEEHENTMKYALNILKLARYL